MRTSRLLHAFFLLAFLAASFARAAANPYILDFQRGHDLKLIYDAGLRPWKETNSSCMVGGAGMKDITYWKIILPNGESFDYSSNMASFEIMEDDSIGRIDFSGVDDTPIQDAAAMTKEICTSLSVPIDGFDEMVSTLNPKAKFNEHPKPENGWGHRAGVAGLDFDLMFVVRPFLDHTAAQVNITIQWPNRRPDDPTFSKPPLKQLIRNLTPPLGYEGVSMAPPRRDFGRSGPPARDPNAIKQQVAAAMQQRIAVENITPAEMAPPPNIAIPAVPGADYVAGQDYAHELPHKASVWINTSGDLVAFETKVDSLLQADKDTKTLYKNQMRKLKASQSMRAAIFLAPSMAAFEKIVHSLDGVLVQTYGEADETLKDHPNPLLLKKLLAHYYLYVDSQDARWPSIIASLGKLDPPTNAEVLNEVKSLQDSNKDSDPGFHYGKF